MNGARCRSSPRRGRVQRRVDAHAQRRQHRRKRRGRGHSDRERHRGVADFPDAVVAHVGPAEAPQRAGLHVGRVDDEARRLGKILQRRVAEEMLAIGRDDTIGDLAGEQHPLQNRAAVNRTARETSDRLDKLGPELCGHAVAVEGERAPREGQAACRDRAAGDARHSPQSRQIPELVEPPEASDVEEHGPITAAREAQGQPGFGRANRRVAYRIGHNQLVSSSTGSFHSRCRESRQS